METERLSPLVLAVIALLLVVVFLTSCGPPQAQPITCVQAFPVPELCVRRRQACFISPYDGLHCDEVCDDGVAR